MKLYLILVGTLMLYAFLQSLCTKKEVSSEL